jgi:pyruvate,water dikinase
MHTIRWLGDHECHEVNAVGGKAASLSRLAGSYNVPSGFAVPALPARLPELPAALVSAIDVAYRAMGERRSLSEPAVAVRSSALDEDGGGASFAGQHDTYLNIRGGLAVIDAVQRCLRSALNAEALAYRAQKSLDAEDVRIAVLVQELVPADVSAVAFSANPVTGRRDEMMINANWGLGESIVGGTATPDTYVLNHATREVVWRDIARKERMTMLADMGTEDVHVPADKQTAPCLDDAMVSEIGNLAAMLEAAMGSPVDIECAFAGNVLYLLQCRPITTLG